MVRILHSSDLHGKYKKLLAVEEDFDIWLDTGDFFDNRGRTPRTGYNIIPSAEVHFQKNWLHYKDIPTKLKRWLKGRPAILVPGNHDFLDLATILRVKGAQSHRIIPAGVEVGGFLWAGFREINPMDGEWPGETDDFSKLIEETFGVCPDILVTHAPPKGILDEIWDATKDDDDYGIVELAEALATREHHIKAHFFGHAHKSGGHETTRDGVRFFNGSHNIRIIEL